jgi:hypothetical protein
LEDRDPIPHQQAAKLENKERAEAEEIASKSNQVGVPVMRRRNQQRPSCATYSGKKNANKKKGTGAESEQAQRTDEDATLGELAGTRSSPD